MNKTRFTIDVGGELDEQLVHLAETQGVTKAEIVRRAVATYLLLKRETKKAQADLAIVDANSNIVLKIAVP